MNRTSSMFKTIAVAAISALAITACKGGGGGSTSTGGTYYTHEQLAAEFIERAYGDAGIDGWVAKANTYQYNWAVFEDAYGYFAVDLSNYNVGDNVGDYLDTYGYRDVWWVDGTANDYEDAYGNIYTRAANTGLSLTRNAAQAQTGEVQHIANNLVQSYNVPAATATLIAQSAAVLANSSRQGLTEADLNNFTQSFGVSGSTFTAAANKAASGDMGDMNRVIDTAAEHLNVESSEIFDALTSLDIL